MRGPGFESGKFSGVFGRADSFLVRLYTIVTLGLSVPGVNRHNLNSRDLLKRNISLQLCCIASEDGSRNHSWQNKVCEAQVLERTAPSLCYHTTLRICQYLRNEVQEPMQGLGKAFGTRLINWLSRANDYSISSATPQCASLSIWYHLRLTMSWTRHFPR